MCSTPQPTTTSWTPEAISAAPRLTACWPEPHWRSTVVAGTSSGSPACSQALRVMLKVCSPNCCTQPPITSPTSAGSMPGALDQRFEVAREQGRGVDVRVVALLRVAAADRRADRLDDHHLAAREASVSVLHLKTLRFPQSIDSSIGIIGRSAPWYGGVIGTPL